MTSLCRHAHSHFRADLYLIQPPHGALHKPVPPSKIVIAGDSAGAGLVLTLLTVLRDMGVEQPAGAVLISPWVDLTHSFPSVMKNMTTVSSVGSSGGLLDVVCW